MCPYPEKNPNMTMSWEEVKKNLEFIKKRFEFKRFDLSGGEPTIYPHFFKILEWFKVNLPDTLINIHTNAVRFSDKEFATKVSKYNVRCFVSFHYPNSKITKEVTGKDHYKKIIIGLKNMSDNNIKIYIDVVLIKQNQDLLDEVNENISIFSIKYIEYRLAHLTNKKNLDKYKPDIVGLKEKVINSFKSLQIEGVKVNICNFPTCLFGSEKAKIPKEKIKIAFFNKKHQLEDYSEGNNFESSISERKFYDSFVKKETCTQCILNKYCKGIDKEYYENIKENIKAITPE